MIAVAAPDGVGVRLRVCQSGHAMTSQTRSAGDRLPGHERYRGWSWTSGDPEHRSGLAASWDVARAAVGNQRKILTGLSYLQFGYLGLLEQRIGSVWALELWLPSVCSNA